MRLRYISLTIGIFILSNLSLTSQFIPSLALRASGFLDNIFEAFSTLTNGFSTFMMDNDVYLAFEAGDYEVKHGDEFDFIVVGAGSAGIPLAVRLSDNPKIKVLLIEAGDHENLIMDVPLAASYLQFFDSIQWKYTTERSNRYCLAMKDQSCKMPAGKVIGGTSVINNMIASRGHPQDYDNWEALGNVGWGYRDVLPYFKKIETMAIEQLIDDREIHGQEGPITISYPMYRTVLADAFVEAAAELGFPFIDYNGEAGIGSSFVQATMENGERQSTNTAYLHALGLRKNLEITYNSRVTKIHFDEKGRRATSVEFVEDEFPPMKVFPKKDIILASGAISSAHILLLSGIGPKEHLQKMGIKVVADLPVGKNFMDHVNYGALVFPIKEPLSIRTADLLDLANNPGFEDYVYNRTGPFTIPAGVEGLLHVDIDRVGYLDAQPNVELLFIGSSIVGDPAVHTSFGIPDWFFHQHFREIENQHAWSIFPSLLQPKSRGEILLRTTDFKDQPIIRPNFYDDPEDVHRMISAIRLVLRLAKTRAMQDFKSKLYEKPVPGCQKFPTGSNSYWNCAIRKYTFPGYDFSGTCRMGPANDSRSVVDPRLKVIGLSNLRVADASIIPVIPTGHTYLPTVMIGEKSADIILEDWKISSDDKGKKSRMAKRSKPK